MQQSIDFQSPVVDKQINAYIALGVIVVNVPKESIQIHWSSIIEKQITDEFFLFERPKYGRVWQSVATLPELLKAQFTTFSQ